jgi:hypothetical protein
MKHLTINFNTHYKLDLNEISKKLEQFLKEKIISLNPISNIYSSSIHNFEVTTATSKRYFLRMEKNAPLDTELKGTIMLSNYLKVSEILISKPRTKNNPSWLLTNFYEGKLMSEYFCNEEATDNFLSFNENLLKLEEKKELELIKSYKNTRSLNKREIIKTTGSKLFSGRVLGERKNEYYDSNNNTIGSLFNKNFIINGREFNYSPKDLLEKIKSKLEAQDSQIYTTYLGHNDAHQGNILIEDKSQEFVLIDCEYADYATAYQDLAKPYYIDYLGTYFFYFPKFMRRHIKELSFKLKGDKIAIDFKIEENFIKARAELVKIKLNARKNYLNGNDFLTLNEYLLICHLLTKNPNNYPLDLQILFLATTFALNEFNPNEPEDLFKSIQ